MPAPTIAMESREGVSAATCLAESYQGTIAPTHEAGLRFGHFTLNAPHVADVRKSHEHAEEVTRRRGRCVDRSGRVRRVRLAGSAADAIRSAVPVRSRMAQAAAQQLENGGRHRPRRRSEG